MATVCLLLGRAEGAGLLVLVLLALASLVNIMPLFLLDVQAAAANSKTTGFYESFDTSFDGRWIVSESPDYEGKWKHEKGDVSEDYGLLASEPAKKYAIAVNLPKTVHFTDSPVVLQYDLRLQKDINCGGAYLKFLVPQKKGWTASQFDSAAPYSIMFGPDICGETEKVHFIFRHQSQKTGQYVEHHLKVPPPPMVDRLSHVYTAVIYPHNNTLKLLIDGEELYESLAEFLSDEDFEPAVVPPKTLPDPEDRKPVDWDERAQIADPEAVKPESWDEDAPKEIEDEEAEKPKRWLDNEPDEVDDPKAVKPKEWDDKEDGEWEAPKIPNPKCYGKGAVGCGVWERPTKRNPAYKGKWSAPLVDNPAYMGVWKPREVHNPDWFELEKFQIEPIAAIGIEIWTMEDGILFDNILITHDEAEAARIRETTWRPKFKVEKMQQDLAEKARKKGPDPLTLFKNKIFELAYQIAEHESLASYKEQILELLEKYAEKYQTLSIVGVFGLIATVLAFMYNVLALPYCLFFGKNKKKTRTGNKRRNKVPVSIAKKEDLSTSDDPLVDEQTYLSEKADEPIEGIVENAESALGEIEKEEERNAARRRHRRKA